MDNNEYKDIVKRINDLGEFCTTHFKAQLEILKFLLQDHQENTKRMIEYCKNNDDAYDRMNNLLQIHTSLTKKMVESHDSNSDKIDEILNLLKQSK